MEVDDRHALGFGNIQSGPQQMLRALRFRVHPLLYFPRAKTGRNRERTIATKRSQLLKNMGESMRSIIAPSLRVGRTIGACQLFPR